MGFLITGGCGFLGSNIAADLLGGGQPVIVFDNLSRHGSAANLQWLRSLGSFEFVHGDVRNAQEVASVVQRADVDVIFHVAGQVAMTTSMQNPRKDFEINVGGSVNLLEAVRLGNPDATVIYSSSNKVYGALNDLDLQEGPTRYSPGRGSGGIDESARLEFHTPYGCSKGAAILSLATARGINPAEILAIGDNWNDVSMLEIAGSAVLMDNAPEDLKALARGRNWRIGLANTDDGVAAAIESALGVAC